MPPPIIETKRCHQKSKNNVGDPNKHIVSCKKAPFPIMRPPLIYVIAAASWTEHSGEVTADNLHCWPTNCWQILLLMVHMAKPII